MIARTRGFGRALLLSACLAAAGLSAGCSPSGGEEASQPSAIGGAFRLTDTAGRTVTDQTLKGKPYAIFFGFTRCPDVCPTTLNRLAQLHERLGADANKLNMVFVSVDPGHDRPEDIAAYLKLFPVPIMGLTGTEAELKQVEEAFKLYVKRVPLDGGDYTMDHTAAVYLMDRSGNFYEPMSESEPIDANLGQLRKLIEI